MKICAIRGRGLASLHDPFEVLLDRGPLGQSGLYSITGQTGAGKSTILDAMCLALFGQTPRLKGRSKSKIGRLKDGEDDLRLSDRDPRALLSRGCGEGFAEVEFVGIDKERYRARWSIRRSRKSSTGRLQKATMDLFLVADDRCLSDHTLSKTLVKISECLGLSFDQFCRSVLLAQGDFAAFLRADDKERADLLERMTGTEVYRRLSIACHERNRDEQKAVESAKSAVAALEIWEPEVEKERQEALAKAKVEQDQAQAAFEGARVHKEALARRLELKNAQEQAYKSHQADEQRSLDTESLRQESRALRAVEGIRPLYVQWQGLVKKQEAREESLAKTQAQAQGQVQKEAQARLSLEQSQAQLLALDEGFKANEPAIAQARALDAQLAELDKRAKTAQAELDGRQARLQKVRGRAQENAKARQGLETRQAQFTQQWPEFTQSVQLFERKDELIAVLDDLLALQVQHKAKAAQVGDAKAKASQLEGELKKLGDTAREEKAALEKIPKQDAGEGPEMMNKAQALGGWIPRLGEARLAAQTLADALGQIESLEQQEQKLLESQDKLNAQKSKLGQDARVSRETLKELDIRCQEAKGLRDQAYAVQVMQEHQGLLQEGKPCPLCGATEHDPEQRQALGSTDAFTLASERLQTLEAQVAQHQKTLQEAEKEGSVIDARLEPIPESLASMKSQRETLQGSLPELVHKAKEIWREVPEEGGAVLKGLNVDRSEALEQTLATRADASAYVQQLVEIGQHCEQSLTRINAWLRQAQKQRGEIETRRAKIEALQVKEREASAQLAQCSTQLAQLEAQDQALVERSKEYKSRLTQLWKDAQGPWRGGIESLTQLRAQVQTWLEKVGQAQEEQARLVEQSQGLSETQRALESELELEGGRVKDAQTQLQTAQREQGDCQDERQGFLQGQAVQAFLDAHQRQRQTVQTQRDRQKEAFEALQKQRYAFEAQIKSLEEQTLAGAQERDQVKARFVAEQETLARPESEILRMLKIPAAQVQALNEKIEAVDRALAASRTRWMSRKDDLEKHREAFPELPDPDAHAQVFQEASLRQRSAQKALVEIEHAVAENDAKKQKQLELEQAHVERIQRAKRWGQLNELIGHSEGHRFQKFAQGLSLDRLLLLANRHLQDIDRRYRLVRVQGDSLDLQVVDTMMGDEIRSVHSLSGGEGFLISLALALGLSSLSAMHTRVESLFIDEGFGTLDRESLEQVLAALDALQATGRQVGLISHVEGMAEQIGAQVQVLPRGHGKSVVAVQGRGGDLLA